MTALFLAVTTEQSHHIWASIALPAYALSFLLSLANSSVMRNTGALVALCGSLLIPIVSLICQSLGQPEIQVVRDGGQSMLDEGTPYATDPSYLYDFRPYLPGMFVFGLFPTRLGDPRIPATLLLIGALLYSVACFADRSDRLFVIIRIGWVVSCPIVALAIATSFIDVPQAAFTLLALAALCRNRFVISGLLVGLTLGLKPTAACALFILCLTAIKRRGVAAGLRLAVSALCSGIVIVAPILLTDAASLWRNAFLFPAGRSGLESSAGTPFPGVLLRQAGLSPSFQVLVLMAAALVVAALCIRYTSSDMTVAARLLAGGLTLAFLLLPYSRAGYLVLPILVWLPLELALHRRQATSESESA